jgi:hypothetical protein
MTPTVNREYRLRPLRTSSTMAVRPHGVYFRNCLRSNFRRGLHRLSSPRQNGRSPPFPILPPQDRLTLWLSGMRDRQSTQGSTQVRTVQTGDVPAIPEQTQTHAFSGSEDVRGFFCRSQTRSLLAVRESNGGGTPNTAHLGLFIACTRVDTCHPCDCMHSFSVRASHHLENHMSFQKDLG